MTPEKKVFRIPVRTSTSVEQDAQKLSPKAAPSSADELPPADTATATDAAASVATAAPAPSEPVRDYVREAESGVVDWQTVAMRLQADAQAYRQRQALRDAQRLAEERERLLLPFFEVLDNLERTLAMAEQSGLSADPLYQGVVVTYRGMCNLLEREGVTVIEAVGVPFDPALHEAVATVPGTADQAVESLVVQEVRRGYRQGERVMRPARVVVAQLPS